MKGILGVIIIHAVVYSLDDAEFRKHYGLSFHGDCGDYNKVFKCMTVCKSIGYQIHRLNRFCKCTCHEMRTRTVVPFFKWMTNGTTRKRPKTFSPRLYDVVGVMSQTTDSHTSTETTDEPKITTNAINTTNTIHNQNSTQTGTGDTLTTIHHAGGNDTDATKAKSDDTKTTSNAVASTNAANAETTAAPA